MNLDLKIESSIKAWLWRLVYGPAQIVDGLIAVVTLSLVKSNFALYAARQLAQTRCSNKWDQYDMTA